MSASNRLDLESLGSWPTTYAQKLPGQLSTNTSAKLHLQKVLSCRHPCYTQGFTTWDLREVVSPNFYAFNGWDCMEYYSNIDIWLRVGPRPKNLQNRAILLDMSKILSSRYKEMK